MSSCRFASYLASHRVALQRTESHCIIAPHRTASHRGLYRIADCMGSDRIARTIVASHRCTLRNMAARMTRACAMKIGLGNYPEVVAQRPAALPCQSTRRTATIGDLCTADQRGEAREGRTCHPRASLLMRSNTGAWPKHWGGRYHTPHATPPSRRSQRLLYE